LQGLDVDFDFTQSGGKARFAMANGSVDLAGWFAEPVLPLAQLSGALLSATVSLSIPRL
jgi:ABC-type nitrate/sulfonate/bicarbonate transport system substrate-binding protein